MIRLKDLTKRYGKFTAVDAISLDVPRGELFGLLGPNGAGKTTTMRMIAGILRPTSGSVHIGGVDLLQHPLEAKSRIGFIPVLATSFVLYRVRKERRSAPLMLTART